MNEALENPIESEGDHIDDYAEKTSAYGDDLQENQPAKGLIAHLKAAIRARRTHRVLHPKVPKNMQWDRGGIIVETPEWLGYDILEEDREAFMAMCEKPRTPPYDPNYESITPDFIG